MCDVPLIFTTDSQNQEFFIDLVPADHVFLSSSARAALYLLFSLPQPGWGPSDIVRRRTDTKMSSLSRVSLSEVLSETWNLFVLFCSSVPRSAPKNLRVSEEWYNRFRISWEAPPTPTKGYRVVYQPLSGE